MSSSSYSVAQPEKCNDINVAVENNNSGLGSGSQEVTSERRSENPSLGFGSVPTGNGFMQRYTSEFNNLFICRFCSKLFSTSQGLGGHMGSHKNEQQWEKKRKEMEQEFHFQWMLSGYSQDALSNDNHLGPFKRRCAGLYPSFTSQLADMNMSAVGVPRMARTHFSPGNTFTNGSFLGGLEPIPSYNNYPMMLPRNVSLFPPNRTNNLPSSLYPQENVLNEENFILKLGNDNIVETRDDDQPEEGTFKNWGADLSLSL